MNSATDRSSPLTLGRRTSSAVNAYKRSGSISPRIALSASVNMVDHPNGHAAALAAFHHSGFPGFRALLRGGGELPVALAAFHEMQAHGGARAGTVVLLDRVVNGAMLVLERVEVGARSRDTHGLARNDEASEIFEEARELRVSRGLRDSTMEEVVFVDRRFIARDGAVHRGERV